MTAWHEMSYYISKDPDYGLVFEDALVYTFGLSMPMPKLMFTDHALFRSGRIAPIAMNK
ncbi:MAG: hypothetical protein GQ523_07635 [Methanophagales archaeon]|nr:hypothetical protein [Methanophagales archaeon]